MLQGQRDLGTVGRLMLSELTPLVGAHQAVIYQTQNEEQDDELLRLLVGLCRCGGDGHPERLRIGEGLIGQCAADRRQILISDMPPSRARRSRSGLFKAPPKSIIVLPVLFEGQVKAVIELASLSHFTELQIAFLEQLTASIGIVLNSIEATMQTEDLLQQPRSSPPSCRPSRANCSRPTSSSSRRRSSSPSGTPRSSARTRKSSRPAARWKRRPPSWP